MPAGVSAYTALANVTLGSTASSVTFSSIAGSYRDLVLVTNIIGATAGDSVLKINLNSDTASNYSFVSMGGNGSTASSTTGTQAYMRANITALFSSANQMMTVSNFQDYSVTDKHKTVLHRADSANNGTVAIAGRWASTSAITTIALTSTDSSFAAGSTFALYGVSE